MKLSILAHIDDVRLHLDKKPCCSYELDTHHIPNIHKCQIFPTIVSKNESSDLFSTTVRNTEIHPLFIENAKFLLADLYITCDNLFIILFVSKKKFNWLKYIQLVLHSTLFYNIPYI